MNPVTHHRTCQVIQEFRIQGYKDSFRTVNPDKIDYTWSNHNTATRIDHIWIPHTITSQLLQANHTTSTYITGSNHKLVLIEIYMAELFANAFSHTSQLPPDIHYFRQINTDWKNITKDDWSNFKLHIESSLPDITEIHPLMTVDDPKF